MDTETPWSHPWNIRVTRLQGRITCIAISQISYMKYLFAMDRIQAL